MTFSIRPMTAADTEVLVAGFRSLSPETLRRRFFSPMPRLPSGLLADLALVDPATRVVLLGFDDASGRLAGGARAVRTRRDPRVADVAVTVGDCFQRRGLGTRLLRALRREALAAGIERFGGFVLADNDAAKGLVRRAGGSLDFDEPGVLRFEIPLAPAARQAARGEGAVPAARPARPGSGGRAA